MIDRRWCLLLLGMLSAMGCGPESAAPIPANSSTSVGSSMQPKTVSSKITVAAASDLKYALDELIVQFEKQHPQIDIETTYGSSGNFYAQLTNKAPFDIYFSADIDYSRKLSEQKLTLVGSEFPYAVGQIVVWVRNESTLDLEQLGIQALLDPSVRKIAIANPKHAPYGRAAEAALKHLGVYAQVKDRLVLGENISQAAQFVESGAADVGIIALSLALAPAMQNKGRSWEIPLEAYPPLEQGGVILAWVQDRPAAESLRAFVVGQEGRAILGRSGFKLPGE